MITPFCELSVREKQNLLERLKNLHTDYSLLGSLLNMKTYDVKHVSRTLRMRIWEEEVALMTYISGGEYP